MASLNTTVRQMTGTFQRKRTQIVATPWGFLLHCTELHCTECCCVSSVILL